MLVASFPLESATSIAQRGGPQWSESEWLQARLLNLFLAVYRDPKGPPPAYVQAPVDRLAAAAKAASRIADLLAFEARNAWRNEVTDD